MGLAGGRRRRDRVVADLAFPPEVAAAVRDDLVLEGLRDWLHVCIAGAPSQFVSLPSRAVADAWRVLLRTPAWAEVVQDALGDERADLGSSAKLSPDQRRDGLWRTWAIACRREAIEDVRPDRLPRLFTVDRDIGMPDGVVWSIVEESPPFSRVEGTEPTTICVFAPSPHESLLYMPWGVTPDKRGI